MFDVVRHGMRKVCVFVGQLKKLGLASVQCTAQLVRKQLAVNVTTVDGKIRPTLSWTGYFHRAQVRSSFGLQVGTIAEQCSCCKAGRVLTFGAFFNLQVVQFKDTEPRGFRNNFSHTKCKVGQPNKAM